MEILLEYLGDLSDSLIANENWKTALRNAPFCDAETIMNVILPEMEV